MNISSIKPRSAEIWENAFALKQALDKKCMDTESTAEIYKKNLNYQLRNHTIADIALQNVAKDYPIINEAEYFFNMYDLEQIPEVKPLAQKVLESYSRLYPKTGYIREVLIREDRFSLMKNTIKPKMDFLQKLKVKYIPHF